MKVRVSVFPGDKITVAALLVVFVAACLTGCGAAKAMVPDVSGLLPEEAEGLLRDNGLEPGEIREGFSDQVPRGRAIASQPPCDAMVERGSRIALIISRGPEKIEMPALLGMSEADADASLRELGFQVERKSAYSEEQPEGRVCASDPAPGSLVENGSMVSLTISMGSAYTDCPECGGSGQVDTSDACPLCGGAGIVLSYETCPECGGRGMCPT